MKNPIEAKTNAITGETVYEEMSDADLAILNAEREAERKMLQDKEAAELQLASAKKIAQAKLEALGLTTGDLEALGL
jgi:hypothetical protein